MVAVSKEMATLCVPIKTYNLINNEIPLLCITEGESELSMLVSKYRIGQCFAPNQIKEMADFIVSLKSDERMMSEYKKNLRVCSREFTPENAFKYLDNFKV
jgi:hypothetical protein